MRDFRYRPRVVTGHPVVKFLFEQLVEQRLTESDLAERTGIHRDTLRNWRTRYNPRVTDLDAALRPLGFELRAVHIDRGGRKRAGS